MQLDVAAGHLVSLLLQEGDKALFHLQAA